MSYWTYINGTIEVSPLGRTQEEKEYILKTVLNHLPRVTGSEGDMDVYINQENGYTTSCSCDEHEDRTNNLIDRYGNKSCKGWLKIQDHYLITVNASLRDREFDETYREFIKWLIRLSKRVYVEDILVRIKGYSKATVLNFNWQSCFYEMFEHPSWNEESQGEPTWCEYLMWDRMKDCRYPMLLGYKYYSDEVNDEEVERRREFYGR